MKWIFVLVALVTLCTPAFANVRPAIYDLETAKKATQASNPPYYIQTARFLTKPKALNFEKFIRSKTSYPLNIVYKNRYYYVIVGPILKPSEVRRTAQAILARSSATLATQHQAKIKKQHLAQTKRTNQSNTVTSATPVVPTNPVTHKTTYSQATPSENHWFASVGAGVAIPSFNSNLTVENNSGFPGILGQDTYTTHKSNQPLFEMALGHRWERHSEWFPAYSLGLYYQHFFPINVGNYITQYSTPAYTNYSYSWDVSSDVFLAGLKLNLIKYGRLSPYLTGAAGCALNKSENYTETALPGLTDTRVSAGYQTKTMTQFAYNVGLGLDFQATQGIIVSAEYQYQNLGTMSLGHGLGAWSSQSLSLGTYHTNAFLLNLTYLLG